MNVPLIASKTDHQHTAMHGVCMAQDKSIQRSGNRSLRGAVYSFRRMHLAKEGAQINLRNDIVLSERRRIHIFKKNSGHGRDSCQQVIVRGHKAIYDRRKRPLF
jgi:hypothetical protein